MPTTDEHVDEHAEEHADSTDEHVVPDNATDDGSQAAEPEHVDSASDDAHANGASEEPVEGNEVADDAQKPEAEPAAEAPAAVSPTPAAAPAESPKKVTTPASPVKKTIAGRLSVVAKPGASKAGPPTPTVKKVRVFGLTIRLRQSYDYQCTGSQFWHVRCRFNEGTSCSCHDESFRHLCSHLETTFRYHRHPQDSQHRCSCEQQDINASAGVHHPPVLRGDAVCSRSESVARAWC